MQRESSARAADSVCLRARGRGPLFWSVLSCTILAAALPAHAARRCYSPATASRHLHHRLCVKAHVYQEINLDDGTRILDVCRPETHADQCRFAFVSLDRSRSRVGSLESFVGKEIEVRGTIRPVHGRAEILLSNAKQIRITAARKNATKEEARVRRSHFHPNPALLKGFDATQSRMPIADPAFRSGYRN